MINYALNKILGLLCVIYINRTPINNIKIKF